MNAFNRGERFAPGKLWSLLEMLELMAQPFVSASTHLSFLEGLVGIGGEYPTLQDQEIPPQKQTLMRSAVAQLSKDCILLSARSTKASVDRFLAKISSNEPVRFRDVHDATRDINMRFRDEMAGKIFLVLNDAEQTLYSPITAPFGGDVENKFPTASEDISEAGKCLALGRNTASVFHIMRALEVATTKIAASIGASVMDKDGKGLPWGVIADNMKVKIDVMQKGNEQIEWYKIQAHLVVLNRAWRVPTAHPKQTYTTEEAKSVMDAAKTFMQGLALIC